MKVVDGRGSDIAFRFFVAVYVAAFFFLKPLLAVFSRWGFFCAQFSSCISYTLLYTPSSLPWVLSAPLRFLLVSLGAREIPSFRVGLNGARSYTELVAEPQPLVDSTGVKRF